MCLSACWPDAARLLEHAPQGWQLTRKDRGQVRVDANATCNVVVYAAYWIVNRTHHQAHVRMAPRDVVNTAWPVAVWHALESLVTVPALPLRGVDDALVSTRLSDGASLYTPRAAGLKARGSFPLTPSLPSVHGVGMAAGSVSSARTGGRAGEGGKGLALLADLADDQALLEEMQETALLDELDHLDKPPGVTAAAARGASGQAQEAAEQEWSQGGHVKLFSLIAAPDQAQKGVRSGVQIRLGCTGWSEAIAVTGSSAIDTGKVDLRYAPKPAQAPGLARLNRTVQVGVAIQSARGRFHRTKTITLTPRYLLVNQLPLAVLVRQEGTAHSVTVPPAPAPGTPSGGGSKGAPNNNNNELVWHWTDERKRQNIEVALASRASNHWTPAGHQHERWSGAVDLDKVGDSVIMVPVQTSLAAPGERALLAALAHQDGFVYVDVRVRRCLGSICVLLKPCSAHQPPYWIDNFSPYTLRLYQKDVSKRILYLRAYQGMPYSWETPLADASKNALVVEVEGSSPLLLGTYTLDRVGDHKSIIKDGRVMLHATVRCDGPTLTLTMTDAQLHPNCLQGGGGHGGWHPGSHLAPLPLPLANPALHPHSSAVSELATAARRPTDEEARKAQPLASGPGLLPKPEHAQRVRRTPSLGGFRPASGWAQAVERWVAQVDIKAVGIGVSLVESEKQRELLYVWLGAEPSVAFSDKQEVCEKGAGGLAVSLWNRCHEQGLQLSVRCLQIDNLTAGASCPVVVCRSRGSRVSSLVAGAEVKDILSVTVARSSLPWSSIQVCLLCERACMCLLDAAPCAAKMERGKAVS